MKRQSGLATVEFAWVVTAFFLIVLSAVELSRLLFTWNMLNSITQRAARVAAVCPPNAHSVTRIALLDSVDGENSPLPGFSDEHLEISYLDRQFSDTGGAFPIHFVRARIVGYRHQVAIPFLADTVTASPDFSAIVPAESLGYSPETGERSCFGESLAFLLFGSDHHA